MPDEITAPAMDGAVETPAQPEPSSAPGTESQASGSPADAPETTTPSEPQPTDWKAKAKDDPDLARAIKDEANRLAQRIVAREQRKALRAQAAKAVENEDVDTAIAIAGRVAAEQDEDDGDTPPALRRDFQEQDQRARAMLAEVYEDFADESKALHRTHKAEWDARYAKGPVAFARWVRQETLNARIEARAKTMANALAPAIAESKVNETLRSSPTPLTGGSGNGDDAAFIDIYNAGRSNDHARARKILAGLR